MKAVLLLVVCLGWDLAVEVESKGHLSIVVMPGFHSKAGCMAAAASAQKDFTSEGDHVVGVMCVDKSR